MITSTKLKNFKGFRDEITFPTSKINLLTGINGRGKSSFLQSILLLRQSLEEQESFEKVIFNGSCVNLGTFHDVKNRSTSNDSCIEITHNIHDNVLDIKLVQDEQDDMIGRIAEPFNIELVNNFMNVHYIAADRIGPQEFYIKSTLPKFNNVGTQGEYVGNVLLQKKSELVHDTLILDESNSSHDLEIQTGKWLSKILDTENVKIFVSNIGSSRVISLEFGIGQSQFRPTNVGFGYSYVLPIIVSGLIAKEGEILVVENPEAHLHPKGQSNLIQFLSIVASCGVQVYIESHSEHILNSLILSTLNKDIAIQNSDVSTLYFLDNSEKPFVSLKIENDGSIDNWPEGFFDQQEIDLAQIFKLGRKV
jgi:predicted ATPase